MFEHTYYVPILKWKMGEYKALSTLDKDIKDKIVPLIEVIPIPIDFETEEQLKTVDEHLKGFANLINVHWGTTNSIFIDLSYLEDNINKNGKHPLTIAFNDCRSSIIKAIPVTGLNQSEAHYSAIKDIIQADNRGVCIRILKEDLEGNIDLSTALTQLLYKITASCEKSDIVIDFQSIPPSAEDESIYLLSLKELIKNFPDILKWRTFIFAGTSFPSDLRDIKADDISSIRRTEWDIWKSLSSIKSSGQINRMPIFGDYGIAHPELPFADFRKIKMSANIRYTADNNWIIFKGRNTRNYGFEQFYDLAEACINHPSYKGTGYSWGDTYIYNCAQKPPKVKTGNAATWRQVGNSHHLTLVVNQIASFLAT